MATEDIEETNNYRRLEELNDSDYEIADDDPDIKGWDIRDKSGAKLAEVQDVLFNPAAMKVRYIIAHLEDRVFGIENRKVLIPIGLAELHEKKDIVYLPTITLEQLAAAPDYIRGELLHEDEVSLRNTFSQNVHDPEIYDAQTFYEHDHYNERNFYGRRFTERDEI